MVDAALNSCPRPRTGGLTREPLALLGAALLCLAAEKRAHFALSGGQGVAEAALLGGHGVDLIRLSALPAKSPLSCWQNEGAVAAPAGRLS